LRKAGATTRRAKRDQSRSFSHTGSFPLGRTPYPDLSFAILRDFTACMLAGLDLEFVNAADFNKFTEHG
jgi:hypothetical protein